jgi:hypothetical protein
MHLSLIPHPPSLRTLLCSHLTIHKTPLHSSYPLCQDLSVPPTSFLIQVMLSLLQLVPDSQQSTSATEHASPALTLCSPQHSHLSPLHKPLPTPFLIEASTPDLGDLVTQPHSYWRAHQSPADTWRYGTVRNIHL